MYNFLTMQILADAGPVLFNEITDINGILCRKLKPRILVCITTFIEERGRGTGLAVEAAGMLTCQQLLVTFWARRRAEGLGYLQHGLKEKKRNYFVEEI